VTLEPRSTCGFSIFSYNGYLETTHMWPVIMHHDPDFNGSAIVYNDTEFMVWGQDFREPDNCLQEACTNAFEIIRKE